MSRAAEQVLRDRAQALAQPLADTAADGTREVLRWSFGGQSFALPLEALRAVVPTGRIAAVPHAPSPLLGMITFRGRLLPAYDPRPLLASASNPPADGSWALVVEGTTPFALLADEAPTIEALTDADLLPASMDVPAEARRCLEGVDRRGWAVFAPDALQADPRLTFSAAPEPGPEKPTS